MIGGYSLFNFNQADQIRSFKAIAISTFNIVSLKLKPQEKCLFLDYLYLYLCKSGVLENKKTM
jgi:hypothetical protein